MAKKGRDEEPAVASLNPDDMLAGGLKDDFRGRIVEAVYAPWDYEGNIDEPVLAARLTIQELDDDGEPVEGEDGQFTQHWSAGDLAHFVPSQDGKNPTDGEGMEIEPGPFAIRVGKRAQLNNNTNFAHLLTSIIDCGEASKKFGRKDLTASLECLEGLDAHWNRVPQKKRSGLVDADGEGGEKKRARDVLVVTEVYGYGEESGKKKGGKVTTKSTKVTGKKAKDEDEDEADEAEDEEDEVSELDQAMQAAILEKLADGPVKKGKLPTIMLAAFAKDKKQKAAAVKRCGDDDFLQGGPWNYDEDTGVLTEED